MTNEMTETIAVVDLGSTSFHLVVAHNVDGRWQVVDRLREIVQLAEGLDENDNLVGEVRQRAINCLKRFGERLREMPAGSVRVVGTNTFRRAHNIADFLIDAQHALGHPISVISGVEEARLIYLGVAQSLNPLDRTLVLDIGGGSTEMIIGAGLDPLYMESLYMGCVGTTRTYFPGGSLRKKNFEHAILSAHLELQPVKAHYKRLGWSQAMGASGTIRTVEKLITAFGWQRGMITSETLRMLIDALVAEGDIQKIKWKGVRKERLEVLPGGVAILMAVFEALGIEQLKVSDGAIREGLLYDQLGRLHRDDTRDRSIQELCQRYRTDKEQARRVETTALYLLSQVAGAWRLSSEIDAQLLSWASRLHELGLSVAHDQYHKHGAYLVQYSDLPGFSRQEQILLATLIRGHRRKFPLAIFKELPQTEAETMIMLCVLLRLAVLLHRSRSDEKVAEFQLSAGTGHLQLQFVTGWLEQHPLTRGDLEQEEIYLRAAKIRLSFQ